MANLDLPNNQRSSLLNPASQQVGLPASSFSTGGGTSGGLFGTSSTSSNAANSGGGSFGNSNTGTQPGLFGNSSTINNANTNKNVFGMNSSGGTGFGFSNTASSGLFGNAASSNTQPGGFGGIATSSSRPFGNSLPAAGSLVGNSATKQTGGTQSGGLSGSQATTNTTSGLFGNSASASNNASNGIFGAASTPAAGGLFGNSYGQATGINGSLANSTSSGLRNPSGDLFGNSTANKGGSNILDSVNGGYDSVASRDPYKSSWIISDAAKEDTTMPQSITGSLFEEKPSVLREQAQTEKPQNQKTSLLVRLAHTFNVFRTSSKIQKASHVKGIFSQQNYVTDVPQTNAKAYSVGKRRAGSPHLKIDSRDIGDVRKLVIKSTASLFHLIDADKVLSSKRRRIAKPLSSSAYENNVSTDDESSADEKPVKLLSPRQARPQVLLKTEIVEDPNGYFCSPTIYELSTFLPDQLATVSNFIIGRRCYGQVAYNYPVDLLQLYERCGDDGSRVQEELFGKIIKIDRTMVRAYDDPHIDAPPMGCELNVPATITLVAPPKKNISVDDHIKRLQNITGMNFITYDPILYQWTFRVKHFSVWGLIDDSEDEADEAGEARRLRDLKKQQDGHEEEANATYSRLYESSEFRHELKRQKVERQTGGLPGGWNFNQTEIRTDSDSVNESLLVKQQLVLNEITQQVTNYKEGESAQVRARNASDITAESDESDRESDAEILVQPVLRTEPRQYGYLLQIVSSMPDPIRFDELIDEKAYEPDIEDEQALDIVRTTRPVTKDWILQLELANDIDSALAPAVVVNPARLALQEVNEILYGDFSKSCVDVEQASTPKKENEKAQIGVISKSINKNAMRKLVQNVLVLSKMDKRTNGYPLLTLNEAVKLNTFSDVLDNDEEREYLELACILFDRKHESHHSEFPDNIVLAKRLDSLQQRKNFGNWLRHFYERQSHQGIVDDLEKIRFYVCCGDLRRAIETALLSGNLHIASLMTLLDLSDLAAKKLASAQLESWSTSGAIQHVPSPVIDIHHILAGQYDSLSVAPLPDLRLALEAFYANTTEKLHSVLTRVTSSVETPQLKELLQVYSLYKSGLLDRAAQTLCSSQFSLKFQWILFRMSGLQEKAVTDCDAVTRKFAMELEDGDLWREAVAILASLIDDNQAQTLTRSIILRNVERLQSDDEKFLVYVLKIPRALIHEAISIEKRTQKDYWGCAEALAAAELWQDAHEVICRNIGPETVIESDRTLVARLMALIDLFPNRGAIISSWNHGAGLFARYFKVIETEDEKLPVTEEDVSHILENMALSPQGETFMARVAFKVMSRRVADLAIEKRLPDLSERLASLKVGENEQTYLSSRLAML